MPRCATPAGTTNDWDAVISTVCERPPPPAAWFHDTGLESGGQVGAPCVETLISVPPVVRHALNTVGVLLPYT